MNLREYIITLHNHEDLDSFYDDMESPGGNVYIPDRKVDVMHRRPLSRNTHYMLTDNEANQIRLDPRVLSVELALNERGIEFRPVWSDSSDFFSKSNSLNASHKNWGLLRCVEGTQRAGWGTNGTTSQSGTINTTSSGKNVDVVIVDGHINPNHPEFAVNSDGTGGSRVNQFNWFSLNPYVTGGSAGTYVYTPYTGDGNITSDNDHGCHVAGIAAGNSQGWARDSNIYNINPYASSPNPTGFFTVDYIREWHKRKLINPVTGLKNPTITNHSYGFSYSYPFENILSLRFNGNVYTGPFTTNQLENYGLLIAEGNVIFPLRSVAYEQDLIDAISEGIIVIGASGNEYTKIALPNVNVADEYNNYIFDGTFYDFYMRGTISAASGAICVGSVGVFSQEYKSEFSNCGPRVDLFAPGHFIHSSVNSSSGNVADSRDGNYYFTKKSGTSMASPQVAGIVACLAEQWPTMKQAKILEYLNQKTTKNQITSTTGGLDDYTDLNGANNRYLYYSKDRPDQGKVGPKNNLGPRPTTGQMWPRTRILRYGR